MKYTVWVDTEFERTTILNDDEEVEKIFHRWFTRTELNEMMKEKFGSDVEYEVWED